MEFIIDVIKLKDEGLKDSFESWVEEVDYVTCGRLQSVLEFSVHEVQPSDGGGETATGGDYLEIIGVTSRDEFAAEMATETFQSLVRQFSEFAEVTATVHLDRLGTGYHSMQEWGK